MEHFAHDHPLIFKESEEIRHRCNACGLYVLSSPCYMYTSTTQCCNFYLHQACVSLPPESHHYIRGAYGYLRKHALVLLAKPREENCLCGKCGKLCENFIYHCSQCEFVLHPLCAFRLDIQIKHISHPQHPLVIVCREAPSLCDACGKKHEGYFFSCTHNCNFWINHDCALLPSFVEVENHEHHLSLIYSAASLLDFYFSTNKCTICSKIASKEFGFYRCFTCGVVTHVDCAISQMKDSGAIVHLPSVSIDTFPSSMIRTLAKERAIEESNPTNVLEKYNAHSLVLIDEEDIIAQESVCNACIQPISPPYYRCSAHSECNFFLHKFCVDFLPLSIQDKIDSPFTGSLASPRLDELFSLFECYICRKYCNGFGYSYQSYIFRVNDLECSFSPRVIEHDSHKQHPLILSSSSYLINRCCGKFKMYVYQCGLCLFNIHIDCARIPKTVTHKFDKHPLTLTFASSNSPYHNSTTDHFCEFCEEDIDSKYWFYHCAECDQSFHVDCIPSQGKFSKIKFGGTVEVPCHQDHPLRLTRMMNLGSQTCGFCHKIIKGFKDGMALHCQDCDFWIHFQCGYQSCRGKVSLPYEEYLIPFV